MARISGRWLLAAVGQTLAPACLVLSSPTARAETRVTTYVIKVQEEREQTRFTLTEWLRIKERMKMMDLWLAMFSDPAKDRFRPELMLAGWVSRGQYRLATGNAPSGTLAGKAGRAQLWLTNLISATLGVRSLNVDFGLEGFRRQTGDLVTAAAMATQTTRSISREAYCAAFRLFGRNIQDSSLVLKGGRYTHTDGIADQELKLSSTPITGSWAGAELQLYLLRALGIEATLTQFGDGSSPLGSASQSGSTYEYGLFIEVSLLRLMVGAYGEDFSRLPAGAAVGSAPSKSHESGYQGGVKLQF